MQDCNSLYHPKVRAKLKHFCILKRKQVRNFTHRSCLLKFRNKNIEPKMKEQILENNDKYLDIFKIRIKYKQQQMT